MATLLSGLATAMPAQADRGQKCGTVLVLHPGDQPWSDGEAVPGSDVEISRVVIPVGLTYGRGGDTDLQGAALPLWREPQRAAVLPFFPLIARVSDMAGCDHRGSDAIGAGKLSDDVAFFFEP